MHPWKMETPSGWATGGGFLEKRKERGRILKKSDVFLPDTLIIAKRGQEVLSNLKRNYEKIMNEKG